MQNTNPLKGFAGEGEAAGISEVKPARLSNSALPLEKQHSFASPVGNKQVALTFANTNSRPLPRGLRKLLTKLGVTLIPEVNFNGLKKNRPDLGQDIVSDSAVFTFWEDGTFRIRRANQTGLVGILKGSTYEIRSWGENCAESFTITFSIETGFYRIKDGLGRVFSSRVGHNSCDTQLPTGA